MLKIVRKMNRQPFEFSKTEYQTPKIEVETQILTSPSTIRNYEILPPIDSALRATKTIEVEQLNATKIQPIGQLHQSYIIAVDNQGLLLIDQHVAHERILFDKFRQKENERKIESQNLFIARNFRFNSGASLGVQFD
ncbi:MAG: hypothetical protein HC846_10980 [Blastocatellia bacterium]|nr:hypothetical protein [Blastocatellia bacterium]